MHHLAYLLNALYFMEENIEITVVAYIQLVSEYNLTIKHVDKDFFAQNFVLHSFF